MPPPPPPPSPPAASGWDEPSDWQSSSDRWSDRGWEWQSDRWSDRGCERESSHGGGGEGGGGDKGGCSRGGKGAKHGKNKMPNPSSGSGADSSSVPRSSKGKGGKGPGGAHIVTKRGGWMTRTSHLATTILDGTDEEGRDAAAKLWPILEKEQTTHGDLKPWALKASILLKLVTEGQTAEAKEMARSIVWTIDKQLEATMEEGELVEDRRRNHLPWD